MKTNMFLDIIHHSMSDTGLCVCLQVKPTPGKETSSIDWAQLNKFYLKPETKSGQGNVVLIKARRWIMSKNIIFVLMYHRHKLLDPMQHEELGRMAKLK
jgi:hypothetical protein